MLYQIHRYPADLIDVVQLPGGDRVTVRPVLPQDKELTDAFFRSLSATSRYNRLLGPARGLSADLLARLTDIDYSDHVALLAEVFEDGQEIVIAEARYARGADKTLAEFAVSVAEDWQGKGLASLLLSKLAMNAAAHGVQRLCGQTLAGNSAMLHMARRAGFATSISLEAPGLVQLEKVIDPSSRLRPCAQSGSRAVA